MRLRLREAFGDAVTPDEWVGTAWGLRLRVVPPGAGRQDLVFDRVARADEFFSPYVPRDERGMPLPIDEDGKTNAG